MASSLIPKAISRYSKPALGWLKLQGKWIRKNDFAWFETYIAEARANNAMMSGAQPEYRAVTAVIAKSLDDDALEMAITTYGDLSLQWRVAKAVLATERERRNRRRQRFIAGIAIATLVAAVAAVAVPFLVRH